MIYYIFIWNYFLFQVQQQLNIGLTHHPLLDFQRPFRSDSQPSDLMVENGSTHN
jgi:hypothetical protein